MSQSEGTKVVVTHHFAASAERVFDAWLDVQRAKRFFFATEAGEVVRAEIDPRVGGRFVIVDRRNGEDVEHVGAYVEIARPHRLVFDFAVPRYSSEKTRVSIDIVPDGAGCTLTLTHGGVWEDFVTRTQQGWSKMLASLASSASLEREPTEATATPR